MPIDPSIPLGASIGPQVDPYRAFDFALRMRQAKRLEEQDAQESQYRTQLLQERQQALAQQVQEREEKQKATQEYDQTMQRIFSSGKKTSDAVIEELYSSGQGHLVPLIEPHLKAFDEHVAKVREGKKALNDALGEMAVTVKKLGDTPGAFRAAADIFKQQELLTDEDLAPYLQRADSDPSSIAQMTTILAGHRAGAEPKASGDFTLGPEQVRYSSTGEEIARGVPKPEGAGAKPGSIEDYMVGYAKDLGKTYDQLTTKEKETGKRRFESLNDRPQASGSTTGTSDVKETVAGMKDGSLPPLMPGRASPSYTAIMAEAHRQGFDLARAAEDWSATQKYLGTLNGAQQVRLRQAVSFTKDSLGLVEDLAKQWDAGKFPLLNRANLALAKGGAMGQQAQSVATRLDAQINDLTSELGTVYKGGNSSTDESLKLAAQNLKSDWSKKTMLDNIGQIRKNLEIREHSIHLGAPAGVTAGNPYTPPTGQPAAPAGNVIRWGRDAKGNPVRIQ